MIDLFSIVVTHGLLALAAWRLLLRADLDLDPPKADSAAEEEPKPQRRMRAPRD
jgi:hypothetical protein